MGFPLVSESFLELPGPWAATCGALSLPLPAVPTPASGELLVRSEGSQDPHGGPLSPLTLGLPHSVEGASQPLCRGLRTAVAKQQEVEVAKDNAVLS